MREIKRKQGCFIVLEGLDGSGKSTQAQSLVQFLSQKGMVCHLDREPTDGPVGRLLRSALRGECQMDPRTLALLFAADRLEHVTVPETGILARLQRGEWVISDRYYLSSYAYQMADMPLSWVCRLNQPVTALCRPDMQLFIDSDPEICLARISGNRADTELFENRQRLEMTRANFFKIFHRLQQTERIVTVNGNVCPQEVFGQLCNAIAPLLPKEDI